MSLFKNYWPWLVLLVLLVAFLVVQFWMVPEKVAAIKQENAEPVRKFQSLEQMKNAAGSRGGMPTAGDLEAIRVHARLFDEGVVKIRSDWRRYTDGLNAGMSNGRNARGEVFMPGTATAEAPGEPVRWNLFAATLDRLYKEMFAESERKMSELVGPRMEQMVSDRLFASDVTRTRQTATEQAKKTLEEMGPSIGRVIENPPALNPVNVGDRFDVEADPLEIERGWAMWRHYLIMRDLLVRVIPAVEAEVDTQLMCYLPVGDAERTEHVRAMETDDLPAGLEARREPKPVKIWRYVERVTRVVVSKPELGKDQLDAVGEIFKPKAEEGAPAAEAAGGRFGLDSGGTTGGAGSFYDRYTVEVDLIAHPKALAVLEEKLLNSAKDAGMFYEPVSVTLHRLPDDVTLPGGATERLHEALGRLGMSSRQPQPMGMGGMGREFGGPPMMDEFGGGRPNQMSMSGTPGAPTSTMEATDPADLAPLELVNRYDREAPVEATLVYHLYRFRYLNTDNETYRAPLVGPDGMTGAPMFNF